MIKNKIIILCGGRGKRMGKITKDIPKPMVRVKGIPIIQHIIKHYMKYGFNDFLIASGYKGKVIKHYFQNKKIKGSKIKVINTGLKTLTGGRLKRLKKYIKSNFFLTYGDGISNVNLKKLLNFHKKNKKIVTSFKEKPQTSVGWINGGFFVMEKKFLNSIKGDITILEKEPLENISKKKTISSL